MSRFSLRSIRLSRVWLARGLAVVVDLAQMVLFPVFLAGAASPVDDVVDVAAAIALTTLVGWHIAFVPSFIVKLLPIADVAPTWTLAVWIATRGSGSQGKSSIHDPLAEELAPLGLPDAVGRRA